MRLQKGQKLRLAERKQLSGLRFHDGRSKRVNCAEHDDNGGTRNVSRETARRSRRTLGLQKRSECRQANLQVAVRIQKVSRFLSVSKGFVQMELVRRSQFRWNNNFPGNLRVACYCFSRDWNWAVVNNDLDNSDCIESGILSSARTSGALELRNQLEFEQAEMRFRLRDKWQKSASQSRMQM